MSPSKQRRADRRAASRASSGRNKPGQPTSTAQQQRDSRVADLWKAANVNGIVALLGVAVGAAGILTAVYYNPNQRGANEATIKTYQANQYATLSQYADRVSFGLGGIPNTTSPQLIIENASGGWLRNLTLFLPAPVTNAHGSISAGALLQLPRGGFTGQQVGILLNPKGQVAWYYYTLPDIPPCQTSITSALSILKSPKLSGAALAKSQIIFTDKNGTTWRLYGDGKLVRAPEYKPTPAFTWSQYSALEQISGCSPT